MLSGICLAQHWQRIFSLPSVGSAACFYNPAVGCIGTGDYPGANLAQIFWTTDGGQTWTRSLLPNMGMFGEVTDLFYYDRLTVWATIREYLDRGWSGIYKSTDGGRSFV